MQKITSDLLSLPVLQRYGCSRCKNRNLARPASIYKSNLHFQYRSTYFVCASSGYLDKEIQANQRPFPWKRGEGRYTGSEDQIITCAAALNLRPTRLSMTLIQGKQPLLPLVK